MAVAKTIEISAESPTELRRRRQGRHRQGGRDGARHRGRVRQGAEGGGDRRRGDGLPGPHEGHLPASTDRPRSSLAGIAGQSCLGYLPAMSLRTSCHEPAQNPARSLVTCTGRSAGDSRCSVTGTAAAGHGRRLGDAEHLLHPHRQHRRVPGRAVAVAQRHPPPAGHGQGLGRQAVEVGDHVVRHHPAQGAGQVDAVDGRRGRWRRPAGARASRARPRRRAASDRSGQGSPTTAWRNPTRACTERAVGVHGSSGEAGVARPGRQGARWWRAPARAGAR